MANFAVDPQKCTACGLCVRDCPISVLTMAGGQVRPLNDNCLWCGHCQAICPTGALTLHTPADYPSQDIEEYDPATFQVDPATLLRSFKFRRSVRHFTAQPLPPQVVRQVLEAGRFSPTGVNRQDVRYIVLERERDIVQAKIMRLFRFIARTLAPLAPCLHLPMDLKKLARAKDDFLFKRAPTVIVVTASSEVDGALAAVNMEQMAHSLGLGALYVGFFTHLANWNWPLRRYLNIPWNQKIVACLALGYPAVRYQRTVARRQAQVDWR